MNIQINRKDSSYTIKLFLYSLKLVISLYYHPSALALSRSKATVFEFLIILISLSSKQRVEAGGTGR